MWPSIWRLAPDVQSSKSLDLVAIDTIVVAMNWNSRSSHTNQVQRPWQEIKKTPGLHLPHLYHVDWDSIYMPHWGSLADVGMPPTWEKVVTYLLKPPDFENLRDGCNLPQLLLPNKIFSRILTLHFEPTQGDQKCDRWHRDARWTGGLSHQSSNLPCLCNLLWKVVIHACSDTGFKGILVVNYLAN